MITFAQILTCIMCWCTAFSGTFEIVDARSALGPMKWHQLAWGLFQLGLTGLMLTWAARL